MKSQKMHHVYEHLHRDVYQLILESQNHCCRICGRHESEFTKRLHIDHDHSTGEVRGLLCHACNLGLGYFRDDKNILKSAIDYITSMGTGFYLSKNRVVYNDEVGVGDWRRLEDEEKDNISNMKIIEIMNTYKIKKSTAFLWKACSKIE